MTPDNYQSLLQAQSSRTGWCTNPRLFSHGLMGVGLTVAAWAGWSAGPAIAQSDGSSQFAQVPARARAMSTLTLLYVNPIAGDDAVGNGGERAPFKTITQALKAAQPNTVIVLVPGTYSAQTGEVFPLKLKPGVTIQGDTRSHGKDILIQGGGPYLSPTFASQNVAILGAHQAGLAGVTVTNPNPRGYGLWIESTSPVILENTFTGNTHDGISVVGSSAPVVRGNYFYANGANGITIYGNSRPEVRENLFIKTGFGINVAQDAAPTIIGNRIVQNQDGIVAQANAQPIIRGNLIEQNLRDGVVAIAQARPDLGSTTDPGANIFNNNGRFDLNTSASSQAISAFGNELASDRTSGRIDLAGTANPDSLDGPASAMPAEPVSIATKPATPTQTKNGQPLEVRVQPFRPVIPAQAIATLPSSLPAANPVSNAQADFPALEIVPKATPPAESTGSVKSAAPPAPIAAKAPSKLPTVERPVKAPAVRPSPPIAAEIVVEPEPPQPTANSVPTPPVTSEVVVAATPRPTVTTTQPVTNQPVAIAIEVPRPETAAPEPAITPIEVPRPEVRPVVQPATAATASAAIPIEVPPPETTAAIAPVPKAPETTVAIAPALLGAAKTTPITIAPPKEPEAAAIAPTLPKAAKTPAIASTPSKVAAEKPASSPKMTAAAFPVPTELEPENQQPAKVARQVATQPSPALRPQPIAAYSFRNRRPIPTATGAALRSNPPGAKSRQPAQQLSLPPIPKPGATAIAIPVPPPESTRTTPVRVAARPSRSLQLPVLPPKPVAAQPTTVAVATTAVATSIEIPVPAPETNAVIPTVPPEPTEIAAIAAIPQTSSSSPSGDVLPVPGPDIPVGYGGEGMPSVLVARNPLDATNSLPLPSSGYAAALGSRYRVVVQVESEDEQAEVAAIAPNAFRTLSNGRMVVQVGSFSNRDNADKMMQTLSSQGLKAAIEALN